jgi:Family of unknown function (DUF5343)
LASDGTPTDLYRRFKNNSAAGAAASEALKKAYSSIYEINEYAHELKDDKLKGVILQVTGLESDAKLATAMVGSFKALRAFANFDQTDEQPDDDEDQIRYGDGGGGSGASGTRPLEGKLRLGYTINLNLPPTTDIAIFNAIFKSLREHLL